MLSSTTGLPVITLKRILQTAFVIVLGIVMYLAAQSDISTKTVAIWCLNDLLLLFSVQLAVRYEFRTLQDRAESEYLLRIHWNYSTSVDRDEHGNGKLKES